MKINNCIDCGNDIDKRSKRCVSCFNKRERPIKERLKLSMANTGQKRSEEFCKRMSLLRIGKKATEKTKTLLSEQRRGIKNNFYGKKHSKIAKSIMSIIHGGTGIPYEHTEYGAGFNKQLKEEIRERDNYRCQNKDCNCTQKENGKQLDVHHIDYDKKNCNPDNLTSLCIKCHRKTNSNRDYWFAYFTYLKDYA